MKHSYLLAGIKTKPFLSMIIRNGGISLRYIFRFLFLLNSSIWSSVFSMIEYRKFKKQIDAEPLNTAPVFIVGHWRTGSTFLHQLMALDPQFTTPNVYQVANPDHMLVSKKYYDPVMTKALGNKRPMDNVKMGINEPQEDEYALLKMCNSTPLEKLIFPKSNAFFLSGYAHFIPDNAEHFTQSITRFTKKLTLNTYKTPLYKNPFHSLRIPLLRKIFPHARYIHIYRNPEKVVYSSIHMWNIVGKQNALQKGWVEPTVVAIANMYKHMIGQIRLQFSKLDMGRSVEIKFEDLEANPIHSLQNIYKQLGLSFTKNFEAVLLDYLGKEQRYQKNSYQPNNSGLNQIKEIMYDVLPEYF